MDSRLLVSSSAKHYPEYLLADRNQVEGNIIGCLAKDIGLLDDFKGTKQDFHTKQGRFFFEVLRLLREKGINRLDEISLMTLLNQKAQDKLESYGGLGSLERLAKHINTENWDAYVSNFTKANLFLKLYDYGFNLKQKIMVQGEMVEPYALLSRMPPEEIVDFYTIQLSEAMGEYSNDVLQDEYVKIDDSFIAELEAGKEKGIPFDSAGIDITGNNMRVFPYLSNSILGFKRGTFSMLGAYSSVGKSSWWVSVIMALLDKGCKVLMISNEMDINMFKKQVVAFLLYKYLRYYNLTKKKMSEGNITDEDKKAIHDVMAYMDEKMISENFKFIRLPDSNFEVVKKKIRDNVLLYDFDTVIYDTFKMDYATDRNMKEYAALIKDSRDLDVMAKKYDITMLASIQLSMHTNNQLYLTASCLSQSKQIVEILENLLLMRNMLPEEMDTEDALYCHPFRKVKNDYGEWIEEPLELDQGKNYKILFLNKCRNGANSDSTGTQLLYEFVGDFGIFKEIGYTRVRHKTLK